MPTFCWTDHCPLPLSKERDQTSDLWLHWRPAQVVLAVRRCSGLGVPRRILCTCLGQNHLHKRGRDTVARLARHHPCRRPRGCHRRARRSLADAFGASHSLHRVSCAPMCRFAVSPTLIVLSAARAPTTRPKVLLGLELESGGATGRSCEPAPALAVQTQADMSCRNSAERVPGPIQTNNQAELLVRPSPILPSLSQLIALLQALIRALEDVPDTTTPLEIRTDSIYAIKCT